MVDILESKVVGTNKETWYKLIGTPEDTKPTGEFPVGTGHTVAKDSTFFEIGTQIRYEFDGTAWAPKGQVDIKLVEKTITENGAYDPADDDADGYSSVTVDVDLNVGSKTLTENGTYSASDDELNGYDEVTVNVVGENNCKVERQPAGAELFDARSAIVKVIVPDGYTMISDSSVYAMPYLREIELPSTITKINDSAFTSLMEKIIIHKPEDSISGAPWNARNAEIIWTG